MDGAAFCERHAATEVRYGSIVLCTRTYVVLSSDAGGNGLQYIGNDISGLRREIIVRSLSLRLLPSVSCCNFLNRRGPMVQCVVNRQSGYRLVAGRKAKLLNF